MALFRATYKCAERLGRMTFSVPDSLYQADDALTYANKVVMAFVLALDQRAKLLMVELVQSKQLPQPTQTRLEGMP